MRGITGIGKWTLYSGTVIRSITELVKCTFSILITVIRDPCNVMRGITGIVKCTLYSGNVIHTRSYSTSKCTLYSGNVIRGSTGLGKCTLN